MAEMLVCEILSRYPIYETYPIFKIRCFFFFLLLHFIELLFVVFWLVFAQRSFTSVVMFITFLL